MLITDVLHCPQCWCVRVHVSSFAFLISQLLILLMFKDPLTTKCRFPAFENWISKSNACCIGDINDANNFLQWLTLLCLPWYSIQSALAVSHVSPSCIIYCWLQLHSQPVFCSPKAEIDEEVEPVCVCRQSNVEDSGWHIVKLVNLKREKSLWSEEKRKRKRKWTR